MNMLWKDTFGIYGMNEAGLVKSLGFKKTDDVGYLPIGKANAKIISANDYQQDVFDALKSMNLLGVTSDKGLHNVEVYARGEERTCLVKLPQPMDIIVNGPRGKKTEKLDMLTVKIWDMSRSGAKALAKREYENLLRVDKEGIQSQTTIPVALIQYPKDNELQLIKLREPIATYNDLPAMMKKASKAERKRVYLEASCEGFANWGLLAAAGMYQLDIIPWDHNGELWTHDNGFDGNPGEMTGDLGGPSNIGMIRSQGRDHCIVRDLEHTMSSDEIMHIDLPHGNPYYGDVFSSRIGSTVGSMVAMLTRVGIMMDVNTGGDIKKALTAGYNAWFGRDRQADFVLGDLISEVTRHERNGRMHTLPLAKVIDQIIIPEYVRVAFEIIDGSFGATRKRRPNIVINDKQNLMDYFIKAYEQDWDLGDNLMDTVADICCEGSEGRTVPKAHVNKVMPVFTQYPFRESLRMAEKIQNDEPNIKDINKILRIK